MKQRSEKFLKRRKFLLALPLLMLPFVTLAFWALGGGNGKAQAQEASKKEGLNVNLPGAQLSDESLDKMSLYNKARQDSEALRQQRSMDPYAHLEDTTGDEVDNYYPQGRSSSYGGSRYSSPYGGRRPYSGTSLEPDGDPNEQKVMQRLEALQRRLEEPQAPSDQTAANRDYEQESSNADLDRLEKMMQQMTHPGGEDKEMQQMDDMLGKVLDIQHPERVLERQREQSSKQKGRVMPVMTLPEDRGVEYLPTKVLPPVPDSAVKQQAISLETGNGFYDLGASSAAEGATEQAISAVIHETQTVVSGSTLKLRLQQDVYINGQLIPKGAFVFGTCAVNGERLQIEITSIRYRNQLFPVELAVHDMDAIAGIRIPGALGRDASKQGADQAVQNLQLMSLDPSMGAQVASAGIETAKSFLGKKIKLVRVTVKAGHPVLLLDNKAKQY